MESKINVLSAETVFQKHKEEKNYQGFYQNVIKRGFDIVIGIALTPFVFLLLFPIAIAVKVEDGGPIFYRSMRLGKGFKEFGMLKVRSMKVNSPDIRNVDGSTFNSSDDPRVTKVGRFLREKSLDEIPQVFNIIVGDMSIVGPRPGDVESKDTYEEDEKDKMLVRPGITGYCQAYFRNAASVREKRLYDAAYAHALSFELDMRIIFKTIRTVLKQENIYTNTPNKNTGMPRRDKVGK